MKMEPLNDGLMRRDDSVFASRRPVTGASRVRGDRGGFVRAGRRLAGTESIGPENGLMQR